MADPVPLPHSPIPMVFSPANITGAPLVTLSTALAALAQYLYLNGATLPHDTQGWVSLGLGAVMTVLGALLRGPAKGQAAG